MVTIDVEPDDLTLENTRHMPRLHAFFERCGIRSAYLVSGGLPVETYWYNVEIVFPKTIYTSRSHPTYSAKYRTIRVYFSLGMDHNLFRYFDCSAQIGGGVGLGGSLYD